VGGREASRRGRGLEEMELPKAEMRAQGRGVEGGRSGLKDSSKMLQYFNKINLQTPKILVC